MDARTAITPAGLQHLPESTPISLVGSAAGYAVLVGPADRPRWLHTESGIFQLFQSLDRAVALLHRCDRYRFSLDITGGTPQ